MSLSPAYPAPEYPAAQAPRARRALLVALGLAALGGCQALGGGGGVMPAGDIGPPPSLRGSVPAPVARRDSDPSDAPPATAPTRRLDLPKNARGEARSEAAAERRIRREDIEGQEGGRSSSGGMSPSLTPSGGVGLGGRF